MYTKTVKIVKKRKHSWEPRKYRWLKWQQKRKRLWKSGYSKRGNEKAEEIENSKAKYNLDSQQGLVATSCWWLHWL